MLRGGEITHIRKQMLPTWEDYPGLGSLRYRTIHLFKLFRLVRLFIYNRSFMWCQTERQTAFSLLSLFISLIVQQVDPLLLFFPSLMSNCGAGMMKRWHFSLIIHSSFVPEAGVFAYGLGGAQERWRQRGKETEAGEVGGRGWEWGCMMFVDSVYSVWWGPKVSDDKMALNSI